MKLILMALLVSVSAQARQYMQCAPMYSNSTDRLVISLDGENSTLFMTSGLMTDWDLDPEIRVLKKLVFTSKGNGFHTYKTQGSVMDVINIPSEAIGEYSSYIEIKVEHISDSNTRSVEMSCFSSIYN